MRVALTALMAVSLPDTLFGYLKLGVAAGTETIALRWEQTPVRYYVTDRGVPGVDVLALEDTARRAFDRWQSVPTASITYQFAGFTGFDPHENDGFSTLGFLDMPELDRVLASTSFVSDALTGELLESDIFFNSAFQWSTAEDGEPDHYDLESIAVHEIGHFSGLGHSALGETETAGSGRRVIAAESVMFPIAFPAGNVRNRTLRADDVAGISDVYPDNGFNRRTGSLSGRVTRSGTGLFGAHIIAFHPTTGDLVGNFSLDERGTFSIAGLTPGPYVVRVEPLDDADVDGFFDEAVHPVDLTFKVRFFDRLVVVPRGGDSGTIEVKVGVR